jgi:hypothetical protein
MAKRPVFIPCFDGNKLVSQELIEFTWYAGYSITQKQKSIESLHANSIKKGIQPLLEISSKSLTNLGKSLSAFNLKIRTDNELFITVESAYQGSKIFENGGPYRDFFYMNGYKIKKDTRLYESGKLIGFNFEDEEWPLNPITAFYDWLYLKALYQNDEISRDVLAYKGFTDIEFNPLKSFSCQARTAALYVSLSKRNLLNEAIRRKWDYFDILEEYQEIFIPKEEKLKRKDKRKKEKINLNKTLFD